MLGQNGRSEWSLVFFTLLTQSSVGTFTIWGLIYLLTPNRFIFTGNFSPLILLATLVLLVVGGIFAFLHLGNPFRVGFALHNLSRSWLSREGLFSGLFGLLVLLVLVSQMLHLPRSFFSGFIIVLAIVCGLFLVYSISRLYMLRTVPAWNNLGTPAAFFVSAFLLGAVVNTFIGLCPVTGDEWHLQWVKIAAAMVVILMSLQLVVSAMTLIYLNSQGGAAAESVRLLWNDFRGILIVRWLTALGGICLISMVLIDWLLLPIILISFTLVVISELLGRFMFYGFYRRVGF